MPHSRTYYLRNPISTAVVKLQSRKTTNDYRRYGWTDTDAKEYLAYQQALVERKVALMKPKFASGLPSRLH